MSQRQTNQKKKLKILTKTLDNALRLMKTDEINISVWDFNGKNGKRRVESLVGGYGLGESNERSERLIQ